MRYIELMSEAEIKTETERSKREYRDLSKIEADDALLNKFIAYIEDEKLKY